MDESRTVIDQSHCLSLGKPGTVATGNEGDAQAVEAGLNPGLTKDVVDAPILVSGQRAGDFLAAGRYAFKRWGKSRVNRHREILTWIILFTLGIAQPQSSGCQVDIFNRDRALREPTPGIERNFKAGPHPSRLVHEFLPDLGNIIVSQLWFEFLRRPCNPEPGNGVGLGELASDGFVDELGEEFDLKQRRVVADFPTVHLSRHAPADIRPAMRVFDLARINDALLVQEGFNGLPRHSVTPFGIAFALPVSCDVAGYPCVECGGIGRATYPLLLNGRFVGHSLSFSGVGGIIGTQAGGFLNPFAGVEIASPEIPKWRSCVQPNVRHAAKVGHGRSFGKDINAELEGITVGHIGVEWAKEGYRYTTRQYNGLIPNRLRFSRPSVAHCGRVE